MSLQDKLVKAQELNKTIHDALIATAHLCGEMSKEVQGNFNKDDADAVLYEVFDIADVCKNFAASVALSMMECMNDKEEEDKEDV